MAVPQDFGQLLVKKYITVNSCHHAKSTAWLRTVGVKRFKWRKELKSGAQFNWQDLLENLFVK